MLEFIEEHRAVTTRQIHRWVQPDKHETQTNRDLNMLKKLGMVQCYPLQPELGGGRGPQCWQLGRAGAAELKLGSYSSHYTRRRNRLALEQFDYELEMLIQLRGAGFSWLAPRSYNRQQPKPALTPQGEFLQAYLGQLELACIHQLQKHDPSHPELPLRLNRYRAGQYRESAPAQANDYVFYLPDRSLAFVLIVCPFEATGSLWKSRLEQYRLTAKEMVVAAAFRNEQQASLYKASLKQAGFRLIRFDTAGGFAQALRSISLEAQS